MEIIAIILVIFVAAAFVFDGSRIRKKPAQPINPIQTTPPTEPGIQQRTFDAQSARAQPENTTLQGSAYVVDGDTVVIQKTQIRLFGVDAPEIDHPYGKKAKWALVSLCKGETIRAEITEQDTYGRTVARCYLQDGRDISAEMVKLGLAIDWPKFSGGIYGSMEVPGVRRKLWLADARQKGRMHVWEKFVARQNSGSDKGSV